MSLEPCDSFGFAGLSYSINGLTDSDLDLEVFKIFVNREAHSGVHCETEEVKQGVVLAEDEVGSLEAAVKKSQDAGHGYFVKEESI